MVSIDQLVNVSGQDNLCWMRAANASAIDLVGFGMMVVRVEKALGDAKKDWGEKQKNMIARGMMPDSYEPVWPEKEELSRIYKSFVESSTGGFEMSDHPADQEILRKITLQIAADGYLSSSAGLADDHGEEVESEGVRAIKNNFLQLFGSHNGQAEFELLKSFIRGLDLEHAAITALRRESLNLSKVGKLNIYNAGSPNGGHYQYFPQTAFRQFAKVPTQTVSVA